MLLAVPSSGIAAQQAEEKPTLFFFFSPTCHACEKVKTEFMPQLHALYKDKIDFVCHDISQEDGYKVLLGFEEKIKGDSRVVVPTVVIGETLLSGANAIHTGLIPALDAALRGKQPRTPMAGVVDLVSRFLSFSVLTILAAGLVDGVNPCAFTVIVFFISFLSLQGYKRRELLIIGSSFVFSVFITYVAIGFGVFTFLYSFKGFWLFVRSFNIAVGLISLVLGIYAVKDSIIFRRTGQAEGLALQLPASIKKRIHAVIGRQYRKPDANPAQARASFVFLVANSLVTGFVVSLLEAVCTGQAYLPTLTFVMKIARLRWQAVSYLLLYNAMFIVPLVAVLCMAVAGISSVQFSRFLKRHMVTVKLSMAAMFFIFGIYLLRRA